MDKRIEIKEEDPLADDITSQNEREFFQKIVSMKTSTDTVLLDTDCDMTVKMEVKSETPFIKHPVRQIKTESATCSNNCEMHRETKMEHETLFSDFGSENEGEFLLEKPLIMDKKYNSDHEMCNKIEIEEDSWSLLTETSSVCNDIKDDGNFPPVKSSRLSPETVASVTSDKSLLLSADVPARDTGVCNEINRLESAQSGECTDDADRYIEPLHLKSRSFSHMSKRTQQCSNNLGHKGKKEHHCKICNKNFTVLSNLKRHTLIHEGKVHQCKVCNKSFTLLLYLKRHNLVHEGNKSHQCNVCNKRFNLLSNLKRHHLVHKNMKPHQCTVCNKSFTVLSNLKRHNLVHEGKKTHQCMVCDKRFTMLSNLKVHNLVHEGKKPHQCKVCDKRFTDLSAFKRHNLIHEGKKPHQCKVCNKNFTQLSNLKRHNLVHEGKRPHQCKICDKRFTLLSSLKRHNIVHNSKKPQ